MRAIYSNSAAGETEAFFDGLYTEAKGQGESALDSVQAKEATKSAMSRGELPASVQRVMTELPEESQSRVLDSVLWGMSIYEREHGCLPTADVLDSALHQGFAAALDPRKIGIMDNVGSTSAHDPISSQPNRAVVAITSAIAEAIPFANYLPADISSNEARLVIVSHLAGSTFGGYTANDIMDGVNVGDTYISAERRVTCTLNGGRTAATGAISKTTGGAANVQVLRGRTIVLVNGFPVAAESPNVSAAVANSPISGVASIAGTDYTVGGTITIADGTIALTFSPALPVGSVVEAEGFIDYEADPTISPSVISQATSYSLYATPWRARVRQTIDSKTQYANELGLDLASEALIAVRNQYSMERHYSVLRKAKALGANNLGAFDFAASTQLVQKTRAQVWQDFQAVIGTVDQQMAEDTMDHGITHLYVGKLVAAQLLSMDSTLFTPSGIVARPGVFRLGRLFGRYDVYYTPMHITETSTASQIIAVGRSAQVARNPFVLGDAVPPTYLPLAFNDDMKYGSAFYARNFTSVNPHQPSARGAALINITNLF